ncbi:hypothetical protein [Nocardiopsis sp. L17-MgMaSL7]|uniref:hypothetical protein n=1 Tax=Nocardiopsis sp. L17-MgMaSL7 TaxID=1938893 RepID=UPI0011B7D7FF|nr:hypothetical protein [Nocardiopsis sp. L17-MgMaSL7]
MAAILCVTLWFTLTTGHPLHHGSTSLLALAFSSLCVLYLAALPQRPGAPSARPEQAVAFVWMPWLVAVIPLSLVFSETGLLPWLWPLLLLPLTALFPAFLAVAVWSLFWYQTWDPVPVLVVCLVSYALSFVLRVRENRAIAALGQNGLRASASLGEGR